MSQQKNLYRAYVQALGTPDASRRDALLDELLAPNFVAHDLSSSEGGAKTLKDFRRQVATAFPDQRMEILDILEDEDRVASRQVLTCTHQGTFMGVPATGRRIEIELMEIVRIRSGRIAERWVVFDRGGLINRLREGGPSAP